ncbi:hypothetical protein [Streptomyces sp. NPDC059991]|uniref:hypothetical protein n=1 Tax=unclassified Streptomyces TaxID=2593676 RepID=UPI00368649B6
MTAVSAEQALLLVLGSALLGSLFLTGIGRLVEGWRLPGADEERRVPRPVAVVITAAGVHGLPFTGGWARVCSYAWRGGRWVSALPRSWRV